MDGKPPGEDRDAVRSTGSPPLRVGFILAGRSVPAWQAELMEAVASEPGLDRSLCMVDRSDHARPPASAILATYDCLDRLLDRGRNTLLRRVGFAAGNTPVVEWTPGRDPERAPEPEARERLSEPRLDVWLDLRGGVPAGGLPSAARFGHWTIGFGVFDRACEGLPELGELLYRTALTTASLVK